MAGKAPSFPRHLLLGTVLFGLFVLFDIGLLSWLIFRSLSQREIQRVFNEAETEAEELASQLAGDMEREGRDLYTAILSEVETQAYIDSVLSQRDIFTKVEIWDHEGKVIYRSQHEVRDSAPDLPDLAGQYSSRIETQRLEQETPYRVVKVPVGEVGSFVIGISEVELNRRLEALGNELLRQTGVIGVVTILLFLFAYFFIWWLIRRGRQLEDQAMEAERMAYIGTLASGLAHEIRSPLNSLNLNMQMLEEEVNQREGQAEGQPQQPSGQRLLAITRSEIGRLERLVTDFLNYARPRNLDRQEVRAVELLEHSSQVLAGQIQARGARVEIEDKSGGAYVVVDRAQMNQLLLNLAQNALAATEGVERTAVLRLGVERRGSQVVLEVRDNGVGIPAEEQGRVFDLFYSTRKGGTGLGLAIADRIARAHGGRLELESTPGEGTAVCLALPAAVSKMRPESDRHVPESLASRPA